MAILAGPAAPLQSALVQLSRSSRWEPFGLDEGVSNTTRTAVEAAIVQLVSTMNRLVGVLEFLVHPPQPEPEDDFMRGWGEPGGDIEA